MMSTASPTWQSHYHTIILHPTEARVLMLPGQDGWSLPYVRVEEQAHISQTELIIRAMRHLLGIDTTALYCASRRVDREVQYRTNAIYVLESRSPAWIPSMGARWVDRDALASLPLAIPQQRAVIDTCLLESNVHATPVLRSPWAREGWYAMAEAWIRAQLTHLDYTIAAPIEQVKVWGISCVLHIPTTSGSLYFKAIPTSFMHEQTSPSSPTSAETLPLLFAHEPMLMQSLAALYPRNIPTVLAMEKERCWMLLADLGPELSTYFDKTLWEQALSVYSEMQVAAARRIDTLFAAGCLDRRLDILEAQVDPLLSDEDVLSGLGRGRVRQLRTHAPQLKALCRQLATYAIPQTLVHGDLHPGNIAVQNGDYIYFDWTDACVAHPFFDVCTFLENVNDPNERIRFRDTYLAQWAAYEPLERLLEAFQLAQILGTIHQAVSYQHIIAHMEGTSKEELRGGASYWLNTLLQLLSGTA